jgi:hypothetical protein
MDEQIIRDWWARVPLANVAIATGCSSGVVVIDVDPPNGDAEIQKLEAEFGPLPQTVEAFTGRGRQLFYQYPGGGVDIGSGTGIRPNIDVRANGGYVVAPPSLHVTGKRYRWREGHDPRSIAPAPLPEWLLTLIRKSDPKPFQQLRLVARESSTTGDGTHYGLAALQAECEELANTPDGQRNEQLNRSAFNCGTLIAGGELGQSYVEAELIKAALQANRPGWSPFDEPEIRKTLASGLKAGMESPRRAPEQVRPTHVRPREDDLSPHQPGASRTGSPGRVFQCIDLATIKANGLRPTPWILEGWIAERDVALQAGAAGIGKSTTLAVMATALSSGTSFCGIKPARAYRVLYIDEEMGDHDTARLFLRLGAPNPNLTVASCQGIRLDSEEGAAWLEEQVIKYHPEVLFLDSVQQVFGSVQENDNTALGIVYRRLFALRDRYGLTVVLNHHKPKTNPEVKRELIDLVRGGTAHGTQSSVVWLAVAGKDVNHLNLLQAKRRGGRKTTLQVRYQEDGPEGPITITGEGPVEANSTRLAIASELIVDFLTDRALAKRAEIVKAGAAQGVSEDEIDEALRHLVRVGRLTKPDGKRGYYALVRTNP